MAFIDYVAYAHAEGRLARLLERLSGGPGGVDNIVWIHSVNPPAMEHHLRLYEHAMRGPSPLSHIQREMIALAVSAANDCFY
ncbi:MAG: carboxymuconolactone decarboxylase family protein [Gemmatimonadota bacterium]|nr:carboxymuconolactone decarboxylase family protein [Gemmatimonadota bacterium]MDH3424040.1 carboxymuconolactone decarboxylase family protein [Gemmatimonadota bacterium]